MTTPALPPGFVLDSAAPPMPPGFVIDGSQPQSSAPAPGILARVKEAITGTERSTEQTQALPDWATMPELNSFSIASAKTGLGTLLSNPQETVQIIQANFPGVQVSQDAKGNFLLTSSIDGKQYAIKPGFQVSDIPRAAGSVAAFTPAGRATSIVGAGAASAATQAAIEASQAATGGEFSGGDVALAGVTAAAVPAIASAARAVVGSAKSALQRLRGTPASPVAAAAAPAGAPAGVQAAMSADDLGQTMRNAALGGFGSKQAKQVLAQQAMPDADTLAAARRLGIEGHLQPDHVTSNQAFRQLAQLVKSQTGSTAAVAQHEGLEKVARRANDIIEQVGGTSDVSTLSATLGDGMRSVERQLKVQAKVLYGTVDDAIKPATPIEAQNVVAKIRENAVNLGGEANLPAVERDLLRRLVPAADDGATPTYALLDKLRKDIGAAKRGKQNAFASSSTAELEALESALRADQKVAAEAADVGDVWELAQATSRQYKGIQDDLTSLFGKELDKSAVPILRGAVSDLGKGDTAKFAGLMKVTPPEMRQEVAASGLSSFFQRTTRGGEMDFAGYAKWFEALQRNEAAYNLMMSNLPPHTARQLGDLAKVSRGIAMSKGEFIATGKAINPKVLEAADSLMARIYEEVKRRGVSGVAAEAIGTTAGMPGLASALASATMASKPSIVQAADRLIASPEFIAAARSAGAGQQAAAVRGLAQSGKFKDFLRAIGAEREISNPEKWITQAMQATNNLKGEQ